MYAVPGWEVRFGLAVHKIYTNPERNSENTDRDQDDGKPDPMTSIRQTLHRRRANAIQDLTGEQKFGRGLPKAPALAW